MYHLLPYAQLFLSQSPSQPLASKTPLLLQKDAMREANREWPQPVCKSLPHRGVDDSPEAPVYPKPWTPGLLGRGPQRLSGGNAAGAGGRSGPARWSVVKIIVLYLICRPLLKILQAFRRFLSTSPVMRRGCLACSEEGNRGDEGGL